MKLKQRNKVVAGYGSCGLYPVFFMPVNILKTRSKILFVKYVKRVVKKLVETGRVFLEVSF